MPRVPRFSVVDEIRIAGLVAVLACAFTFVVVGLFDPFGAQADRADEAARRAVAIHLCVSLDVYENRLDQLATNARKGPLTRNERDVRDALGAGYVELKHAEEIIGVNCKEDTGG